MPDIDKVIDEAKAEIKRFGDDVKALQDSFSKDLHDARQLAEDTKAEATGAKAAAESALVKYEELNSRLTKSLDQVGAALTRANFTARHFEIPKGDADEALERAGITCNKNGIPNDPLPPMKTSGIRVGSPAGTTRGFGPAEFREIGHMIADVLDGLRKNGEAGDAQIENAVRQRVSALCHRFPIYPES